MYMYVHVYLVFSSFFLLMLFCAFYMIEMKCNSSIIYKPRNMLEMQKTFDVADARFPFKLLQLL